MVFKRSAVLEKNVGLLVWRSENHLESQEEMHQNMIEERWVEHTKHLEAEKRCKPRKVERMKVCMEFSMKDIVISVKEATNTNK